uniref:Uncharacterized protein n=1 Tax=Siphoviridae sp. ctnpt50 TaxID=2827941 RepID=A0A8S5SED7_9CAUD|nr:MAG TPA: hypothetical protein [Siphoviridae sp. ctnpt50]
MSKCDCYHVEPEVHRFVDENGDSVYGNINVPRCWGTKESDVCDCGGDKLKCNFYERVRAEAAEEKKNLSTTKDVLEEIEGLIGEYWGTDLIYYVDSKNKEEDGAAKLCCKILEAIHMSVGGGNDEKDS